MEGRRLQRVVRAPGQCSIQFRPSGPASVYAMELRRIGNVFKRNNATAVNYAGTELVFRSILAWISSARAILTSLWKIAAMLFILTAQSAMSRVC
jgi:hypothetical protein